MISVQEARQLIKKHVQMMKPRVLPLESALGCRLANDVLAPINLPSFLQASMDGYAFMLESWNGQAMKISQVIPAGQTDQVQILAGEAARIFTGAPMPEGTNTLVKQENVVVENGEILIKQEVVLPYENVRKIGSEITKGKLGLVKGYLLNAPAIGFLASMGIEQVEVYPKPKVHILLTGNELVKPGEPFSFGQIYESNGAMLRAALHEVGITDIQEFLVKDSLSAHESVLAKSLEEADIVLISGGISVGDYDYTAAAAEACGVEKVFHKVKQKPGKPLYFGLKNHKPVFGLPGNPSSVLSCYYNYVCAAVEYMSGIPAKPMVSLVRLADSYQKPEDMTHFIKGKIAGESASILQGQESYKLHSFAWANCLIELEAGKSIFERNEWVKAYLWNTDH